MSLISKLIIPVVVIFIIGYGLKNKVNIYDSFLFGAKEGLVTTFNIFPAILAMVFGINIFLNSGVINFLLGNIKFVFDYINIPFNILPMAILRPISGTASLAIMNDLFINYGPDSYIGRLASVLQGCTDTTIYVIALYFGSIRVTKIKHSLLVGLFADLVGIIMAFILTNLFFA